MFLFGRKAADAATSHLAELQRSSHVAGRCLLALRSVRSVMALPKIPWPLRSPFVLCHNDLSVGALLDELVTEDGEPSRGRLVTVDRLFKTIDVIM